MNTILADRDIRARHVVASADFIDFATEPHGGKQEQRVLW